MPESKDMETFAIHPLGSLRYYPKVVVSWGKFFPPLVVNGFAPTFAQKIDFFTILFFATEASIHLDGRRIEGEPYSRDI